MYAFGLNSAICEPLLSILHAVDNISTIRAHTPVIFTGFG